jgi:hypothetical protein
MHIDWFNLQKEHMQFKVLRGLQRGHIQWKGLGNENSGQQEQMGTKP